ncbi:unnamed protein product [Owenia fusiformis]|uniref:Uncharacterized protein n=1 Tax=Owenia fusiformis TaxID=6347 RepID=A0A8J1UH17_OWEFU|nr:unnamed protein product [Owenia fusiformis]
MGSSTNATVKVPVSTSPPDSEEQLGALGFNYWKLMGDNECMVKSNIINWISCSQAGGSIMEEDKDGPIRCKVIKVISTDFPECKDVTPTEVHWHEWCGPDLQIDGTDYLQFDANSVGCNPTCTWDPCGQGQETRYVKGVDFPHGNVYVR